MQVSERFLSLLRFQLAQFADRGDLRSLVVYVTQPGNGSAPSLVPIGQWPSDGRTLPAVEAGSPLRWPAEQRRWLPLRHHNVLLGAIQVETSTVPWPDTLGRRLAHHFIDNRPARAGLIKGSSGKPDSARIINAMHVELMALQCQTWFGFVYSEDNLSDGPSRGDYALLQRLGAIWRPCKLPRIDCWALPRPPM
jgi:hypothetical protein